MKLNRIQIASVLGIAHLDLPLPTPITIFAGANGAGKSSIQECISMVLLETYGRVDLKKELSALVRDGARSGTIELELNGKRCGLDLPSGNLTGESVSRLDLLRLCIEPHAFADAPANERRQLLFDLMNLPCDGSGIVNRLIHRGCEQAKVDAIAPLLRQGFELAHKETSKRATDSKGAWRGVTGETYGSQKSERWRAPTPAFSEADAAELTGIDKAIAALEADLGDGQKRLGIAEHEGTQAKTRETTLTHLRETAKKFAERADLVAKAEKELAGLVTSLTFAQQKAGAKPVDWPSKLTCPHCGGAVMDSEDGDSIVAWSEPPVVVFDAEQAARIPDLQNACATMEKVLARHKMAMDEADQAAKQLKVLEPETKPAKGETKPAAAETIRATVDTLRQSIETKRKRQAELLGAQKALDDADAKTKAARAHHADVLAWTLIADALAPDGIPGELLAEALGPISKRLAQSAADSGWKPVTIGDDMAIRYGGRAYRLCSASERFRADVMLAEAVSFLSGLKFLVIDAADILDAQGRVELLGWLGILSDEKELDTCIVLATLKDPAQWDGATCVWLERGSVVEHRQAEAA